MNENLLCDIKMQLIRSIVIAPGVVGICQLQANCLTLSVTFITVIETVQKFYVNR